MSLWASVPNEYWLPILQLNIGTVRHETCVLAAMKEADVVGIKHGDLSASPSFCLLKCEAEVSWVLICCCVIIGLDSAVMVCVIEIIFRSMPIL